MARCPFAVWRPLPEQGRQRATEEKRLAILHSADGAALSLYGFFLNSTDLESHFMVGTNGVIEQYLDTDQRADANRFANDEAISIETGDNGDPDNQRWNPVQEAAIVRLLDWICDTHPLIIRDTATGVDGRGIGYHTQFGAPSRWTPIAKSCPGRVRKTQVPGIIWQVAILGLPTNEEFTVDEAARLRFETIEKKLDQIGDVLIGADKPEMGEDNPRHRSIMTSIWYLRNELISGDKNDPNSRWSKLQRFFDSLKVPTAPPPGA
jgi:hypothetical protein